ncbi:MAG: type VI secretion system tip protein VgrG [Acetobacteraceae bacterium]
MPVGETLLSITSAAGEGALRPYQLHASEAISGLFRLDVEALAETAIAAKTLLDSAACVTLHSNTGTTRHFHGIVTEFGQLGPKGPTGFMYRLVLRPRLYSAALAEDCRMFFKLGADDIIKRALADAGGQSIAFRLFGAVAQRPATAQFNETTLHFVTRLMEEEGWFYFFEHSEGDHKMIVADANTGFSTIDATLQIGSFSADGTRDVLTDWIEQQAVTHGEVSLSDYDPAAPSKSMGKSQSTVLGHAGASHRKVFHWPALTTSTSDVAGRAKRRMEAAEASAQLARGAGGYGGLFAGGKFTLQQGEFGAKPWIVRSIEHIALDDALRSGTGEESYSNTLTAFDSAIPWRPELTTARPRMEGLHTAVVLAPGTDEIHTDEQGQIKIRFRWDWRNDATADNSPFVRVVQPWAGNGWGGQFIPRVGTEVAVSFMDADPDRPIVVGGFYNGADKPIFPNAEKTKLGFRSRSVLKGGTDAFSEFSLNDDKDKEVVFLHAQKDLNTEVEHDETHTVDNDRTAEVKGKEQVTVIGDRTHEVSKGNESLTVKQGNRTTEISQGNESLTVKQGNNSLEVSVGNHAVNVKLGNITVKAGVGSITLEATQSITLKVGANTLTLSQSGVELKGLMVTVEGQVMTTVKGPMVTNQASAILSLSGALVKIN